MQQSIWETLSALLTEADDDDKPFKPTGDAMKRILARAKERMASGEPKRASGAERAAQADRDMGELPGTTVPVHDRPERALPRPDQPAPQAGLGQGLGRIALRSRNPTSTELGAKARQFDPDVSTVKARHGASPGSFFGDEPVKVDPETGEARPLRGRPRKLKPGESPQKSVEIRPEPFAPIHAKGLGREPGKKPSEREWSYSAGDFAKGQAIAPKGGEVQQGQGGTHRLKAPEGGEAPPQRGSFIGQRWAPAGFTAASAEEWNDNPTLAARRTGGKDPERSFRYASQATGQRRKGTADVAPGKSENDMRWAGDAMGWIPDAKFRPWYQALVAAKLAHHAAQKKKS